MYTIVLLRRIKRLIKIIKIAIFQKNITKGKSRHEILDENRKAIKNSIKIIIFYHTF